MRTDGVLDLTRNTKTNKALGGALLPANNNVGFLPFADVHTVTVLDESGQEPVAYGAFNQYAGNQAYSMLGKIDEKYKGKRIWIKEAKAPAEDTDPNSHYIQIRKLANEFPELGGLPQYTRAFAEHEGQTLHLHLVDALLKYSVGTENMDSKKNITVDLYADEADDASGGEWRDESGFVVGDRFRFTEITVDRQELLKIVSGVATKDVTVKNIDKGTLDAVVDYDAVVTVHNRQNFIEHLAETPKLIGKVALNPHGDSMGYAMALGDRVLLCYGETEAIQTSLLSELVADMPSSSVQLTIREVVSEIGEKLRKVATSQRRLYRFHTRIVPTQVKWEKVLAMNAGLALF